MKTPFCNQNSVIDFSVFARNNFFHTFSFDFQAITGTNWKEKSWAQDDKLFNLSYFLYSINSSMNYYIYRFLRHREKSDIVDKTSEHEMKRMTVSKSSLSMANNETTVRMEPTSRIE